MMTRQTATLWGKQYLASSKATGTAYLDTTLLLRHVLGITETELILRPQQSLSEAQCSQFQALIQRRQLGEPIAYLQGSHEFWSLTLKITPACLIPRPETEMLVEKILAYYPADAKIHLADLGTGSGAIALALASERPYWHLTATDYSKEALQLAQTNAKHLKIYNIDFRQGNWCQALIKNRPLEGIVSNPPYLEEQDPALKSTLRYEPRIALASGDGLQALRCVITQAPEYLATKGRLWLEQGYGQAPAIFQLLKQQGYTHIQQYPDLSGILRVSTGQNQ